MDFTLFSRATEAMWHVTLFSFLGALTLALVHVLATRLRFVDTLPRTRYLSAAGGVSVAYVFMRVLPKLSEYATEFGTRGPYLKDPVYLMALLGLSLFYGIEQLVRRQKEPEGQKGRHIGIFWLHVSLFSLYNALIGYLLSQDQQGAGPAFLIAMTLHFLVNDNGLRFHYQAVYDQKGRWFLAGAVIVGWLLGTYGSVPKVLLAGLYSFLAGGIVLNTLKEELPEDHHSSYSTFVMGAAGYTGLLLLL